MSSYITILFILSANINQICGKTTESQTVGDNFVYAACGRLCDKPDIDAIAPLSVPTDKQFLVTIVRDGLCSWILDMNEPKQNRDWGRRHHYKYDLVESLYTIFDDPKSSNKFNVTALFTSGMVSETWRSENGFIKKDSEGPLPLLGLGYNMQNQIDASFGWQPDPQTRILKIFQNDSYYSFDLQTKKRVSGPDSLTKDFSYDYKKLGRLQGAFTRGKDIYFFSGSKGYYIWKSNDEKTGVLSEKLSVTKDFYNCGTRYTTPKFAPTNFSMAEDNDEGYSTSSENPKTDRHVSDDGLVSDDLLMSEDGRTSEDGLASDYKFTESGLTTEDNKNFGSVSDSVIDYLQSSSTEYVDVNIDPQTMDPKSFAGGNEPVGTTPTSGHQKFFLSLKLFIILVLIWVLECIFE